MTTVFHARSCGRLIEINSNLGREKLHGLNYDFRFLELGLDKMRNVNDLAQNPGSCP